MTSRVIEHRPDGITEVLHDDNVIAINQPIDDILRHCKDERSINDQMRGFRKPKEWHHVAEIPLALIEILYAQGIDILNNADDMKRFLNDPQNAAFRTSTGTV